MRIALVLTAALACFPLAVGGSVGEPGDRDSYALARRVSNLEKQVADLQRTVERIEKTLSSLPKSAGATNKDLDRQMGELTKAVTDIARSSSQVKNAVAATEKELKVLAARYDARTVQLAKWFDDYQPRKHDSQYHQREAARR